MRRYKFGVGADGHSACGHVLQVKDGVMTQIHDCEGLTFSNFMSEKLIFFPEEV